MGNKTRKKHNTRGKLTRAEAATVAAVVERWNDNRPPVVIEFPFHEVDDLTMMLGVNIPGYKEVILACPAEFKDNYRNPWCQFAEKIFFGGTDMSAWQWRNPALKTQQLRYLRTWLGSFEPSHETKEAVCGWLLSLMLLECPSRR